MSDLTPSEKPEVADGIAVPDMWKVYSTNKDVFDRPPPPADPQHSGHPLRVLHHLLGAEPPHDARRRREDADRQRGPRPGELGLGRALRRRRGQHGG